MIYIKDKKAVEKMRKGGRILAEIITSSSKLIKEGISTLEIDSFIEKEMLSLGLKPVCKGYRGYEYATCISLNDTVVHGIPSKDLTLKKGDLVKIDVVGSYKDYCVDVARCFFVGDNPSGLVKQLMVVVKMALDRAIDKAVVGNRVEDISACIEDVAKAAGFDVVKDFAGHGIGRKMHEQPEIPNFRSDAKTPILRAGMTLAIEPMITEKKGAVFVEKDGWTVRTLDGGLAGHMEDTVLITEDGPEILTRLGGIA